MKNMFLALALAGLTYVPSLSIAEDVMDSDIELTEEVTTAEDMDVALMNHTEKNHRSGHARTHAAPPAACKEANISEAQMKQIKATMTAAKAAKAEQRKAMRAAHIEFMALLKNTSTSMAQAETASSKMLHLKATVAQINAAAKNEILFKTLQPEQRLPAIRCHHAMKARHHARHGGARHARGGHGHARGTHGHGQPAAGAGHAGSHPLAIK